MLDTFDAAAVRRWCDGGLQMLRAHQHEIDELNVYPVPDGDTGTNLVLTLTAALHALADHDATGDPVTDQVGDDAAALFGVVHAAVEPGTTPLGRAMRRMARGALLGARGNSGVIVSQILRGMADSFATTITVRGGELARALRSASEAAYAAVARPVEGTVLSVVAAAAEGAGRIRSDDLVAVARAAARSAAEALARTPQQLPVLARAGVVDAGGRGLCLLLDALVVALGPSDPPPAADSAPLPTPPVDAASAESPGSVAPMGPHQGSVAAASFDQGAAVASFDQGAAVAFLDQGAAAASFDQGAAVASFDQGAAAASFDQGAAVASFDQGAAAAFLEQGAAAFLDQGAAAAFLEQGIAAASLEKGTAAASGFVVPEGHLRGDADNPVSGGADNRPSSDLFGYEVQYLLDADPHAVDALRPVLAALGDSLVVVGTGDGAPPTWNVHVHVQVEAVGAALEAGIVAGRPHRITVTPLAGASHEPPGLKRADPRPHGTELTASAFSAPAPTEPASNAPMPTPAAFGVPALTEPASSVPMPTPAAFSVPALTEPASSVPMPTPAAFSVPASTTPPSNAVTPTATAANATTPTPTTTAANAPPTASASSALTMASVSGAPPAALVSCAAPPTESVSGAPPAALVSCAAPPTESVSGAPPAALVSCAAPPTESVSGAPPAALVSSAAPPTESASGAPPAAMVFGAPPTESVFSAPPAALVFGAPTTFDPASGAPASAIPQPGGRGAVVVAAGDGLTALFSAEGATVAGYNPSTAEILEAIVATGAGSVVLLPNDTNAHAVARAAAHEAEAAGVRVSVVPTRSPVQALAALAVRDPQRPFADDVIAMAEAAGACRYGEVCTAQRAALTVAGPCRAGDLLGLVDGEVHVIGAELDDVSRRLLDRMLGGGGELATLVLGADAPAGLAESLRGHLAQAWPFVEFQCYAGGQPRYHLLVGVE